jgi:hypothetical protein
MLKPREIIFPDLCDVTPILLHWGVMACYPHGLDATELRFRYYCSVSAS